MVQESLPRFIAPGDRIKTGVIVFNNTGKDAEIDVSLNINGPAKVTSEKIVKLDIPGNGKGTAQFTFEAGDKPGKTIFEIGATDGTERALETVELANRPAQPLLTKHGSGIVRAGSPVRISMPTDWLEGTGDYTLQLSSLPAVRFSHGIQYLLSYPYGCIEQTTSKLFPILYFNDLARFVQPEIFGTKGPDYFIAEGIQKLSGMQLPSGEFAFWPGGSDVNQWGSIYASHFLVEARKAGYQVSDDTYDRMIGALKRIANETFIDISRPPTRIYAAYVLAKAGELDKSTLNVLKDVGVQLYPIYVKFLLAAAIAQTSGVNEALYLIPVEIHPPKIEPESGGRFESDIRNNSILLDVLLDVAPENPSVQALAREISEQLYIGGWYTTQSNSFALMALGKFFRKQETPNYTGALVVGGQRLKTFGVDDVRMVGGELAAGEIEISINGTGTCYYFWQSSGVPTERTFTPFTKRLAVERSYLDSDGKPLNLDSIRLGDQIVAKITAQALDKPLEYVVINDLLPSCFEIENPRLQTTGRLAFMPKSSYQPQYMDIRDDRLLLFTNLQPRERLVYYYSIRVISRGEFEIPPVAAECMYDPTIAGASSAGHLRIDDSR
ncbi:MAG: hypothetical protein A2W25_13835 [candidate division Zixibacteria bacterium RBG_16_53_22]|nr:MAG: hypothetical protein A2W25_13835 [candidate division Zixibacteria bacterium RBG_16_53_22]